MKKRLLIILIILFLALVTKVDLTYAATVELFQITNTFEQERGPLVFDNNIIWQDSDGIHTYNTETQTKSLIFFKDAAIFLGAYNNRYLIYDQYFGTDDPREYDIYTVDLATGEDSKIVGGAGSQGVSDIYNDQVVYTDIYYHGFGFGDLYVYNLKKKINTFISSNTAVPRIWRNYVVWYSREGNSIYDIHAYNLADNKFVDIPNPEGASRYYPSIYNKHVVYSQIKEGISSIRLFDISNKQENIIIQSSTYKYGTPDISKNYIVWDKSPEIHKSGIEGFNLKTGEIFEIYPVGDQMNTRMPPRIYDNIVAWNSYRTGNGDIDAAIMNYFAASCEVSPPAGGESSLACSSSQQSYEVFSGKINN